MKRDSSYISDMLAVLSHKFLGAVTIFEFCHICMMYCLLEDIKYSNTNVYDEKYSPEYIALTYNKVIGQDDLLAYLSRIEKEFMLDEGTLVELAQGILERRKDNVINSIFEELSKMGMDSHEDVLELYTQIMYQYVISGRNMEGTNLTLGKLEKALIDIKDGQTLYDGCCGTGTSAVSIAGENNRLFLQDISIVAVYIAAINAIIHRSNIGEVRAGDLYQNPLRPGMKFDRIILEPPFGVKQPAGYYNSIPEGNVIDSETNDADSLPIRHALARLKDDGIAMVCVAASYLFRLGKTGMARKELCKYIDAVIELPSGILPGTSIGSALLVLKKNKETKDIYCINASSYCSSARTMKNFTAAAIQELAAMYAKRKEKPEVAVLVSEDMLISNDYNLMPEQYFTVIAESKYDPDRLSKDQLRNSELMKELEEVNAELDSLREKLL